MHTYDSGTFIVDSSGEVDVDYLFDGGWFRGELALFSLEGMEELTPGSTEFMLEAARRALTNSEQGHIISRDNLEGAKFSNADLSWERDFNQGEYIGAKSFAMTPGDEVGLMLIQHTTVRETYDNPENISQFGKLPIFSIPNANLSNTSEFSSEFVDVDGNGTIGVEDIPTNGRGGDYNDIVLQFVGLEGNFPAFEDNVSPNQDWTATSVGQELLTYADSRVFNDGVIQVSASGELNIQPIFDLNFRGELGIFSLEGMKAKDVGSEAFVNEAISRVQSDSIEGRIILETDLNVDLETENQKRKTFQMEPESRLGLIAIADGTFEEASNAGNSILSQDILLSVPQINESDPTQFVTIDIGSNGVIVGYENEDPDVLPEERDYNDLLVSIEGVQNSVELEEFAIENILFAENPIETIAGTENTIQGL